MTTLKTNTLFSFSRPATKQATLVLDIDETLISVRRWVDEVQIGQKVKYLDSDDMKLAHVNDIHKQVTITFDDGYTESLFFHFDVEKPFDSLCSPLDVADHVNINNKHAVVTSVITLDLTILLEGSETEIRVQTDREDCTSKLVYCSPDCASTKFNKPDLVFENLYLVRFRPYLVEFLNMFSEHFEIILWTAALRSVYTQLLEQVNEVLLQKINALRLELQRKQNRAFRECTTIWACVLYRDNCTKLQSGTYFKDLSRLGRDLSSVIMVDNTWLNFQSFELNGLPIIDFFGSPNDRELQTLSSVMSYILQLVYSNHQRQPDISHYLHSTAYHFQFNTKGVSQMMTVMNSRYNAGVADACAQSDLDNFDNWELDLESEFADIDSEIQLELEDSLDKSGFRSPSDPSVFEAYATESAQNEISCPSH